MISYSKAAVEKKIVGLALYCHALKWAIQLTFHVVCYVSQRHIPLGRFRKGYSLVAKTRFRTPPL